jgi:large subunit ribosomal protein L33
LRARRGRHDPFAFGAEGELEGLAIMAKGNRSIIYLVSSAGTGYYYTTSKNRRSQQEKLKMKKFDPIARKHVLFEEKSKV